tara:strand:- start:549 stop:926 length:378 start_codon:yes stop_codon:yes gene_type:complete
MKYANILSAILGLVLAAISIQWIFNPQSAADSLGMLYLEGDGRNTQIRDFTAFFMGTSIMCFLSLVTKQYQWILCAGIIFFIAALFNVISSFIHDAPIVYSALISEILFTMIAVSATLIYKSKKL